jgi:hypothetical protein
LCANVNWSSLRINNQKPVTSTSGGVTTYRSADKNVSNVVSNRDERWVDSVNRIGIDDQERKQSRLLSPFESEALRSTRGMTVLVPYTFSQRTTEAFTTEDFGRGYRGAGVKRTLPSLNAFNMTDIGTKEVVKRGVVIEQQKDVYEGQLFTRALRSGLSQDRVALADFQKSRTQERMSGVSPAYGGFVSGRSINNLLASMSVGLQRADIAYRGFVQRRISQKELEVQSRPPSRSALVSNVRGLYDNTQIGAARFTAEVSRELIGAPGRSETEAIITGATFVLGPVFKFLSVPVKMVGTKLVTSSGARKAGGLAISGIRKGLVAGGAISIAGITATDAITSKDLVGSLGRSTGGVLRYGLAWSAGTKAGTGIISGTTKTANMVRTGYKNLRYDLRPRPKQLTLLGERGVQEFIGRGGGVVARPVRGAVLKRIQATDNKGYLYDGTRSKLLLGEKTTFRRPTINDDFITYRYDAKIGVSTTDYALTKSFSGANIVTQRAFFNKFDLPNVRFQRIGSRTVNDVKITKGEVLVRDVRGVNIRKTAIEDFDMRLRGARKDKELTGFFKKSIVTDKGLRSELFVWDRADILKRGFGTSKNPVYVVDSYVSPPVKVVAKNLFKKSRVDAVVKSPVVSPVVGREGISFIRVGSAGSGLQSVVTPISSNKILFDENVRTVYQPLASDKSIFSARTSSNINTRLGVKPIINTRLGEDYAQSLRVTQKTIPRNDSIIGSLSKSGNDVVSRQILLPSTKTGSRSDNVYKIDTDSLLGVKSVQKTKSSNALLNIPRVGRISSKPRTGKRPPKGLLAGFGFDNDELYEEEELFDVLVRRRGKFKTKKRGLTRTKALKTGRNIVDNTLAATFKIVSKGTQKVRKKTSEQPFSVDMKNYYSRKPDVYIERRSKRIGTKGEKSGLREARSINKLIGGFKL